MGMRPRRAWRQRQVVVPCCVVIGGALALLPEVVGSRCGSLSTSRVEPTWAFMALSALAIAIGAATHVFWDSFTHRGRWGTELFPQLNDHVATVWGYDMPGYKALQYGSTLVLLPCLALLVVIWLCRQTPGHVGGRPGLPAFWKVIIYMIILFIPMVVTIVVWTWSDGTPYMKLGETVTTSGLVLGVFVLGYCIGYHTTLGRGFGARGNTAEKATSP